MTVKKPSGRGGRRPGSGRPRLSATSATVPITISITQEDAEFLARVGDGNVSEGIRRVVKLAREGRYRLGF